MPPEEDIVCAAVTSAVRPGLSAVNDVLGWRPPSRSGRRTPISPGSPAAGSDCREHSVVTLMTAFCGPLRP
ncbi:MAG: hypothetical protein ACLRWQ_16485 [Flavonifractor plautii]